MTRDSTRRLAKWPANQQKTTKKKGTVAGIACRIGSMGFPVLSNPLRVFNTLQMAQLAAGLKNQSTSELASCHTALPEPADKASYSEYESQFLAFCTGLPIYPWRCTANPHVNTMAAMFFSHTVAHQLHIKASPKQSN